MSTTDIVVHVTNALDARTGQLLVVDYDQRAISALGIPRCVQAQGYSARLVGM